MLDDSEKSIKTADWSQVVSIDNKKYIIEETKNIEIQSNPNDVVPYGWALDFRRKNNGSWSGWFPYWNKKIYNTQTEAIKAALQISKLLDDSEFRASVLYRMDTMQYRNYTIDKLLSPDVENIVRKKYDIKFWKVKKDCVHPNGYKYESGTLFAQLEDGSYIKCATPKNKTEYGEGNYILNKYLMSGDLVDEVDIFKEKWCHPHLIKTLKLKFNIKCSNY